MNQWQKPSFEELEMNAEIGGYQPDDADGGQPDPTFVTDAGALEYLGSRVPHLVAEFLGALPANETARRYG